jgi:phosphomannomutase
MMSNNAVAARANLFDAEPRLAELDPWKPCDLRGVFPDAVSAELYHDIGSAIGTMLPPASRVLIAGDYRLSTPELKRALADGLQCTGVHVLDAGQGPTPFAYFAADRAKADAVLIVTASHNPAAHNGLKLMLASLPTTPKQLARIRALSEAREFRSGQGAKETVDLLPEYVQTTLERWRHLNRNSQPKVILDAGNGAWSEIAPDIFRRLGFDVQCLSCVTDGNFPDRSPDCSRASNLTGLRSAVTKHENSIGIAWDGDGDRVAFIDEEGQFVSPDEISILMAIAVLEEHIQAGAINTRIVVDVKCSDIVWRAIQSKGGTPLLERTGHAFMRGRMVSEQALLGLDACGHYFFRELNSGDDGLHAALFTMDLLARNGRRLADLRRTLPLMFSTPELRIPTASLTYGEAARALTRAFPEASIMEIDGSRFVMGDGVVLIRESGTEPVLSLRIEGFDAEKYDRILSQCLLALPTVAAMLREALKDAISK